MARWIRYVAFAASTLAVWTTAEVAQADASSWLHIGGGGLAWQGEGDDFKFSPSMALDLGVGTDPAADYIFGGLFRVSPVFDHGADLGLAARFCNRGFQTGPLGFAIDLGAYQRFWGATSSGFWGQASLGGPLGLQLSVLGAAGSNEAVAFGGSLGVDLARFITFRETLLDWWPNPHPEDRIGSQVSW